MDVSTVRVHRNSAGPLGECFLLFCFVLFSVVVVLVGVLDVVEKYRFTCALQRDLSKLKDFIHFIIVRSLFCSVRS